MSYSDKLAHIQVVINCQYLFHRRMDTNVYSLVQSQIATVVVVTECVWGKTKHARSKKRLYNVSLDQTEWSRNIRTSQQLLNLNVVTIELQLNGLEVDLAPKLFQLQIPQFRKEIRSHFAHKPNHFHSNSTQVRKRFISCYNLTRHWTPTLKNCK